MFRKISGTLSAVLIVLVFAAASCDDVFTNLEGTGDEYPDGQGEVRLMNLFEDRNVDFGIGDRTLFTDVGFHDITGFEQVSVGQRQANLLESDSGDTLVSQRANFIEFERNYNVYTFSNTDDSLIVRAVENDGITHPDGDTRIRLFNAFKYSPALDVYFIRGDEEIQDQQVAPDFVEIDFNNDPGQELVRYENIAPGDVTMILTESGSHNILFEEEISVEGESSYTILLYEGEEDGTPTDFTKLRDR